MGSPSPLAFPVIDFSEVSVGSPKWDLVKAQVQQALEEYGCFEALFPKMPSDVRTSLFGSLEDLFNLPAGPKTKHVASDKPYHGYIGEYVLLPLYESMGISDAITPEDVKLFTKLYWPQGNADFSESILSYSKQLSGLDQTVRRMIVESLGLEDYMNEHLDSTGYLLRVMRYKEPKTTEPKLGLTVHKDKSYTTILCQNQVDGLEVQTKDGQWINVTYSTPDSFIYIAGLSIHAWTNRRIHSPFHRVMMKGDKPRYSTSLFSTPKAGYVIKAPEKLIDEQHPVLYKPYDYTKFVEYVYTDEGLKEKLPLETYCGLGSKKTII